MTHRPDDVFDECREWARLALLACMLSSTNCSGCGIDLEDHDPTFECNAARTPATATTNHGSVCLRVDPLEVQYGLTARGQHVTQVVVENCHPGQIALETLPPCELVGDECRPDATFSAGSVCEILGFGEHRPIDVSFVPSENELRAYAGVLRIAAAVVPDDCGGGSCIPTEPESWSYTELALSAEVIFDTACPVAVANGHHPDGRWTRNIDARPGTPIDLSADGSSDADGSVVRYEWQIIKRPRGSAAMLVRAESADAQVVTDLPGSYLVELQIFDDVGAPNCQGQESARVFIYTGG